MSRILSYFFGFSEPNEGRELVDNINRHTIFNCEIKYTGKELNYIKFSNQAFNEYLTLYSHPTWDSAGKQIEYKLRCNELFYPHRKTITDFAEAINYYCPDICKAENNKIFFSVDGKVYQITVDGNNLKISS